MHFYLESEGDIVMNEYNNNALDRNYIFACAALGDCWSEDLQYCLYAKETKRKRWTSFEDRRSHLAKYGWAFFGYDEVGHAPPVPNNCRGAWLFPWPSKADIPSNVSIHSAGDFQFLALDRRRFTVEIDRGYWRRTSRISITFYVQSDIFHVQNQPVYSNGTYDIKKMSIDCEFTESVPGHIEHVFCMLADELRSEPLVSLACRRL